MQSDRRDPFFSGLNARSVVPLLIALSGVTATDPSIDEPSTASLSVTDPLPENESSNYIEYSVLVNEEEQNRMEILLEDLENVDIFRLNAPDQFYKFYFEWPGVETVETFVSALYWGKFHLNGSIDLGFLPFAIDSVWLNDNELRGSLDTWALPRTLRFMTIERNRFDGTINWTMLPAYVAFFNIQHNKFHGTVSVATLPESLQSLYISDNIFSCVLSPSTESNVEVLGAEEYFMMRQCSDDESNESIVTESTLSIADRSKEESRRLSTKTSGKNGQRRVRRTRDFYGAIPMAREESDTYQTLKVISETPYSPRPVMKDVEDTEIEAKEAENDSVHKCESEEAKLPIYPLASMVCALLMILLLFML